jgi:MFS family permease
MRNLDIKGKNVKIDIKGALIFTVGLFSTIFYLSISQVYGWISMIYLLVIGILLLTIFVLTETKSANPILDISLFTKNRTFAASNFTAFLNYISTFSIVFVFSIYLQVMLKYNPFNAGIILVSEPVFMVLFSPISGKLADKYGSREIAAIGMGVIGVSFLVLSFLKVTSVWSIIIPLSMIGVGFGLFSAPNTNSVMGSVSREKYGVAAGTLGTMRFTGQLLSIALASTILAASLPRTMLLGLFSGAQSTITLSYYNAFVSGFKVVMLISGILSLVGVYTSLLKNKRT